MRARPLAPIWNRLLHRPKEVVDATVSDELEALLQILCERLVLRERSEMLFESACALEREHLVGVVDNSRYLRPAADHALVLDERVDIAIRHACDALHVESVERVGDRRPLRIYDTPADPRLEHAFAQMLEIVVEGLRGVLRWRSFHPSIPSCAVATVTPRPAPGIRRSCFVPVGHRSGTFDDN